MYYKFFCVYMYIQCSYIYKSVVFKMCTIFSVNQYDNVVGYTTATKAGLYEGLSSI